MDVAQVVAAMLTHLWFRRYEPRSLPSAFIVLTAVPSLVIYIWGPTLKSASSARTVSSILLEYLTFYTVLLISVAAYRVSPLHPLSEYPGPILCKLTKLWGTWIAVTGRTHLYHKDLHDQYGSIVRVGPNELSIIEKDAIPSVLGAQGMPRGPLWDGRRFYQAGDEKGYDTLIDVRDSDIHNRLRKPWNQAFSAGPLKDYQELLVVRGKEFCTHLLDACKNEDRGIATVDIANWISFFSFDVMGDLAFGGCFELMKDGDVDGIWKAMEGGVVLPSIMQHIPWISSILRAIPFISAKMQQLSAFGVYQAKKRIGTVSKNKDLFYHLYEAAEETSGGTLEERLPLAVSNSILTIVAGSDTTATTLSAIVCHLLANKGALRKLREELDEAFPKEGDDMREIEPDKLARLSYLNGVVNEGLRLVPAVPTHLQRAPEEGSGGRILGDTKIFIPEGTAVNIPPYALHRDPRYFSPSPDTFIPERWLTTSEGKFTTNREAFIPFSYGPANCAGKPLAMLELRYITALLVLNFDMCFVGCKDASAETLIEQEQKWTGALKDRFVLAKEELDVEISPRR